MSTNKLTDVAIKKTVKDARAAGKNGKAGNPRRLWDGEGGYLLIKPTGSALWRFKFMFDEKEQLIGLGAYPEVSLAEFRDRRDAARKLVANGVNPSAKRKAEKATRAANAANSFESLSLEWLAKNTPSWAPANATRIKALFENDLIPWLGKRPIAGLQEDAPAILETVQRIEKRGASDTAHRALQHIGRVFRFAVATRRAKRDPTGDLRGALQPLNGQHFAAIVEPKRFGELLRAIHGYQGQPTVMAALKLAPLTFVRPGELRAGAWAEIHLDDEHPVWRIPAERMKAGRPHIVPLARQAVAILRELEPVTGDGRLLFPSLRTAARAISDNTLNAALRRLGYSGEQHVAHGFRSTASSLLNEQGFAPDVIELQLAHRERNEVRAAYNRSERLPERRALMQAWADYLDKLRAGAEKRQDEQTAVQAAA